MRLQDRLDEEGVGAGYAGADVAMKVDKPLMVKYVGALRHQPLEAVDLRLCGHGASSLVRFGRRPVLAPSRSRRDESVSWAP